MLTLDLVPLSGGFAVVVSFRAEADVAARFGADGVPVSTTFSPVLLFSPFVTFGRPAVVDSLLAAVVVVVVVAVAVGVLLVELETFSCFEDFAGAPVVGFATSFSFGGGGGFVVVSASLSPCCCLLSFPDGAFSSPAPPRLSRPCADDDEGCGGSTCHKRRRLVTFATQSCF